MKQYISSRVQEYNESPNICLHCSKSILHVGNSSSLYHTKIKKFCNQKCSASFNNKLQRSRMKKAQTKAYKCSKCGTERILERGNLKQFPSKISCLACTSRPDKKMGERTKKEVFDSLVNWQSARTTIRKHSARVMASLGKLKFCQVCGYSNHVEICHIKAVSAFPEDAKLSQINDPINLVYLCPNHHWEFDNGILNL